MLVGNSKIMLNKNGDRGHPCLVHNLKDNAYMFSIKSDNLLW